MAEEATITVRQVHIQESTYVNFEDTSGKRWNCNVHKYLGAASDGEPIFNPGRRLDVAYNTTDPKPGKKYGSKYINECRPATGPNTWPDKEPYQGGSGGSSGGGFSGGGISSGPAAKGAEFRTPEQIMRGQAAEVVSRMVEPVPIEKLDGAHVGALLDAVDIVDIYISGSLAEKTQSNGGLADYVAQAAETFGGKPDEDIPF